MSRDAHPLRAVLWDLADGNFPVADGAVVMMPPLPDGREAVVACTGKAFIASRLGADDLADLHPDGFGQAMSPGLLARLADGGEVGVHDATLVTRGTGAGQPLPMTGRWDDHQRVRFARSLRADVTVFGDERGFFTIARGLADRTEMSLAVADDSASRGVGRELFAAARHAVPAGEWLFAAVAPGHARSLRAALAAGYVPIASEIIITPR